MLIEHSKNMYTMSRRRVVYEFFEWSTNIPSGLSAYNPKKLVVYCLLLVTWYKSVLNALDFAPKIKENASLRVCIFKIFRGSMSPDPVGIGCQRHARVGLQPTYLPIIATFPPVKNFSYIPVVMKLRVMKFSCLVG